jgi:hypothetical protein
MLRDEGIGEYGAVEYIGTAQIAQQNTGKRHIMESFAVYTFYSSPNIIELSIRGDEIGSACGTCGGEKK